jgi:hypothetical protein
MRIRHAATSVAFRFLLVWFVLAAMKATRQPGAVSPLNECSCGGDVRAEHVPSLFLACLGFTFSVVAVVVAILLIEAVGAPPAPITVALRGSL